MGYASRRIKTRSEERLYRVYVTDALRAAYALDKRFLDIIEPKPDFDPEEVAEAVIRKAGLGV